MGLNIDSDVVFWVSVAVTALVYISIWIKNDLHSLKHIPTIGPAAPIFSYYGAYKYMFHNDSMFKAGYKKYKGGIYKLAQYDRWHVVVSGEKLTEEVRKAPDEVLSTNDAVSDHMQIRIILGPNLEENPYHTPVVRSQLTRSIGLLIPGLHDEVVAAFRDFIPCKDDWAKVPAFETSLKLVFRTSNRAFVGLPLCRDPGFVALNVSFTIDLVKTAILVNLVPDFAKSAMAKWLNFAPPKIEQGKRYLQKTIEQRLENLDKYGKDWPNRPSDMLQWLIESAEGEERTLDNLILRILTVNFASMHSTTNSFCHALYELAAKPEYLTPLREEVETVIREDGWTKEAVVKMRRVDSFLHESLRINCLGTVTLTKMVKKDFVFSDGTFIPKGCMLSAPTMAIHHDSEYYENPDDFDPWRFYRLYEQDGDDVKHQMVFTSLRYLTWGHGKHACPGRFFAATELKLMFAHLVLNYDVKMENEGVVPTPRWYITNFAPNPTAEVLFRKRR